MKKQTNQKQSLEKLLSQLSSVRIKAKVISEFLGEKDIPKQYLDEAIEFYEQKGSFHDAALIAKEAGQTERAVDMYTKFIKSSSKRGDYDSISDDEISEMAEKIKFQGLTEIALKSYEKTEDFYFAACLAKEFGLRKRALDFYVKSGSFVDAGRLAEDLGLSEKAAEFYGKAVDQLEEDGNFFKAARLAKEFGLRKRALDFYVKSGSFVDAGRLAEDLGLSEKAAEFYGKAVDQLEEEGEISLAKTIAEEAGLTQKAEAYKTLLNLSTYTRRVDFHKWSS